MVFLFLEIWVGFPIHLETAPEINNQDPKLPDQFPANRERSGTQQKIQGVHLSESRKGTRDWELFSETAESNKGQGVWQLEDVKVLFYNLDSVDFTVIAKKGMIDSNSKNLKFEGHVVTKSANGYEFKSETLIYNQALRILESPDEVTMQGPADGHVAGIKLQGKKLEAFVDSGLMIIKESVKATKNISGGKKFEILSKSAEFSGKNRLARFIEDVSIEVGSLKMEGPEANFDYKAGVDLLQSVMVKGGVKVSDLDKYATSESVKFDPEQNRFVFNGRPRVVQNNDEITGDQIIFIDGGKKVKVEKIKAKVENK